MNTVAPYLAFLTGGLLITLYITAVALVLAIVVSFVAGLGRISQLWAVRFCTGAFIEVFRGTSVVVQLFWCFYVLPFIGIEIDALTCAIIVLGLSSGAYGAQVVRGAIQAVPKGQSEAAVALGMTPLHQFMHIILPQAISMMIPAFGNMAIELLKATSVVSLITISDLTFRAQIIRGSTGATTAVFSVLLGYYFLVAILISLAFRWLEARVRINPVPRAQHRMPGLLRTAQIAENEGERT